MHHTAYLKIVDAVLQDHTDEGGNVLIRGSIPPKLMNSMITTVNYVRAYFVNSAKCPKVPRVILGLTVPIRVFFDIKMASPADEVESSRQLCDIRAFGLDAIPAQFCDPDVTCLIFDEKV